MKDIHVRRAAIAAFFLFLAIKVLLDLQPGSDWLPLWTAGRLAWSEPAKLYDFHHITMLQPEAYRDSALRPFVYPPTALLFIVPMAQLPFHFSLLLVTGASLALVVIGARRCGADAWLLAMAPPVALSAIVGQMSLLVIGLSLAACLTIGKDERGSGLLLALAALIKPTLLILAPFALIAGRNWRALIWAGAVTICGITVSMAVFGLQPWLDWVDALPRFQRLFADYPPLVRNAVSPYAMAVRLDVEHSAVNAAMAVPALAFTWIAFAKPSDPAVKVAAMLGGAVLVAPYAMFYELAIFAPALLALRLDRISNVAIIAIWGASLFAQAGLAGLVVAYGAVVYALLSASFSGEEGIPTSRWCRSGSIFPPDSSTTVSGTMSTLPDSRAASDAAPPGSTVN